MPNHCKIGPGISGPNVPFLSTYMDKAIDWIGSRVGTSERARLVIDEITVQTETWTIPTLSMLTRPFRCMRNQYGTRSLSIYF